MSQTGRAFYKRFNEHLHSLKNCNTSAKFAHRFRENGHTFGSTEEIVDVLLIIKEGSRMSTVGKYCVYIYIYIYIYIYVCVWKQKETIER